MPDGRLSLISASSARTAFERSSGLAVACLTMPMLSAGLPLKREIVRSSTAPMPTVPRSRIRTG